MTNKAEGCVTTLLAPVVDFQLQMPSELGIHYHRRERPSFAGLFTSNYLGPLEALPQLQKAYIIISNYKRGDKTDCNNYLISVIQNFIQHSSLKVNFVRRLNYW